MQSIFNGDPGLVAIPAPGDEEAHKNLIQELHAAIFLQPKILTKPPDKKYAFGKLNDLYYFTKGNWPSDSGVQALQNKWLGSILGTLFACPKTMDAQMRATILSFLPEEDMMDKAVLSGEVAATLKLLHRVISTSQMIATGASTVSDPDEMRRLLAESEALKAGSVAGISRQLARFAATAGFKRILLHLQETLSKQAVDEAAETKAAELQTAMEDLRTMMEGEGANTSHEFMTIVKLLESLRGFMQLTAALPADANSKHGDLREQALKQRVDFEDM